MNHQAQWTAPSPLWTALANAADADARQSLRKPALLRFANDEYMEEFTRMLETDASRMVQYQAQPETWRGPSPSPEPAEKLPAFLRKLSGLRSSQQRSLDQSAALTTNATQALSASTPTQQLKLYQPAHQRFYLVTACLVCRMAGLPDRALDTNLQERVSFVVRRLRPNPASPLGPKEEYAFVVTPRGFGWQKIEGTPNVLIKDEEQLPMFAVSFTEDSGRKRRIYGALIPVGKREAYMGAGRYVPPASGTAQQNTTPKTARKIHFRMQVAEPWKSLLKLAADAGKILNPPPASPPPEALPPGEVLKLVKESREQAQTLSWLLLLDFANYLQKYLPKVWTAVEAGSREGKNLSPNEVKLFDALLGITIEPPLRDEIITGTAYQTAHVAPSMVNALMRIKDPARRWDEKLESVIISYDRAARNAQGQLVIDPNRPDFLFPLADLKSPPPLPPSTIDAATPGDESVDAPQLSQQGVSPVLVEQQSRVDKLVALVVRALPAQTAERVPAPPLASQPVLDTGEGLFVIRCVYERLLCSPLNRHHLAAAPSSTLPPLLSDLSAPTVLSEPTESFNLAGFFDPDAPARPIRIALPIDTSPAGLRKFDKNTAFMISDVLCGQLQRLKGITFGDLVLSVLPWPFHKDLSTDAKDLGPCKDQGVQLGMICTFSLPIITICALILLMVIVLLFEFIFHWIPLFIMCFPLPGFKAKK